MTLKRTDKVRPDAVRERLRKVTETIITLEEDAKKIRLRCSHMGAVSSYHEYEDSGYECSGCGATWRHKPEKVGKIR